MPLSLDSNSAPIDQNDPQYDDFLADLQGNILNGHGRDHAAHIFVTFEINKVAEVKAWIANFATFEITSAKRQLDAS